MGDAMSVATEGYANIRVSIPRLLDIVVQYH